MSKVDREIAASVRSELLRRSQSTRVESQMVAQVIDDELYRRDLSDGERLELQRSVHDLVSGFGSLQPLLQDPSIEEIWLNSPSRIFVARSGRSELTTLVMTNSEVRDAVERMLAGSNRRLDLSNPFVDATLADGSRLHVVIPDVTAKHWCLNIRKHVLRAATLSDLVDQSVLDHAAAEYLTRSVAAGKNIIVSGGTQAGKTTLLNCLISAVPSYERVITVEEVFELSPQVADLVSMQTRQANLEGEGEITLRRLIKEALRMRPSRVIVGEVRGAEALDLLIALNSGLPGMASIHANSAREAVKKLAILPLLAGENVRHDFITPTVASAIDLVVHCQLDAKTGHRRIFEIVSLAPSESGDEIDVLDVFTRKGDQLIAAGDIEPGQSND
ncbi:putative conjugal transfer proteinc [mine drainage metagenome]|uniref:Putative conjugal transfer proteinc n=1 Tax=mine drainage metagenome TaxID=410659 RepID=A0A1J5Q2X6_9ZZZZ